jgi:aspartate/methionine/tyrosine aminotransferase
MKQMALRMSRLGTETAFRVLSKAQSLESKGIKVVHLEIGEPDFRTPDNINQAACKAINDGFTHYSNSQGIIPLRNQIAKYVEKTREVSIDPARVIVTPGAKPFIFFTMLALLEEGDEAIYPNPGFPIYESMINYSGAKAVPIPLREELDFRLDINELKSLITPRTKLIILNSPENPTGGVLEESDVRVIAELAREHDIYVLSDEVYEYMSYGGKPFSIASLPGMLDRTILMNGFSKTYAMTGWRAGYAVVPQPLVDPIVGLIVNSVSCTATFIQHACIEALVGPQESIGIMVAEFEKRREIMVQGLNSIPGVSCLYPRGAFYAFPNIKNLGKSSEYIADYLLNEAGVACLSGTDFGKFGEGYLRLSYANSQENLREAIRRMKISLAELK